MDALSWIALSVIAIVAVAGATQWLLTGPAGRIRQARGPLAGLMVVAFLLLGLEVVANGGVKQVVFDGWLDSVADSIDGTSDRDERIANQLREGSGGGSFVGA